MAHSRRLALQVGAAGLVALLGETTFGPEAGSAKKTRKQKRNARDRKERRREQRRERKRERKNATCASNEKTCFDTCIGVDSCCTSDDCTGAEAGQCVSNTCQPAFQTCANADGAVSFVAQAPGNPPLSKGAVKFTVGPDPAVNDWAHLRSPDFAGLEISAIQKLEYSSYIEPVADDSCPTFAPYMALYTVVNGTNEILVSVPVRNPVECNTWQTLDAASQKWWMPFNAFAPQNSPKTLAQIADQFPGMTIRNALTTDAQCSTALGGLRLEFGEFPGGGGTGDAVAFVSYLDVAIGDTSETYLF